MGFYFIRKENSRRSKNNLLYNATIRYLIFKLLIIIVSQISPTKLTLYADSISYFIFYFPPCFYF